jgi:hypothetical protein
MESAIGHPEVKYAAGGKCKCHVLTLPGLPDGTMIGVVLLLL